MPSTPTTRRTTGGNCPVVARRRAKTSAPRPAANSPEESGITLTHLGRKLWVRESRFRYKGRDHHRIEHVFLGRTPTTTAQVALKPTDNERVGQIERRWWSADELRHCADKILPAALPQLRAELLAERLNDAPLMLTD